MTCKILFRASLSEPQILEKPEAVYYIYLCVILQSNHSMRMLRYHVVDRLLRLAKVIINAVDESRSRGIAVWLELKDDKNVHHGFGLWQWQSFTVGMIFSGMVASYAILKCLHHSPAHCKR